MPHKRVERDYLNQCHSLIVLGGTFDPIHMGHLAIAQAANRQLKPQRVLFIPSGQPAHKHDRQVTSACHRYNMTALAVCEHPSFDISRLEINRAGPSYTIDTARALSRICPAGAKISFLIGDDALMDILSWRSAEELLRICTFVVVPRPKSAKVAAENKNVAEYIDYLTITYNADIQRLDGPLLDISSTDIRERFEAGRAIHGLMPKPAEVYARQHRLYASQSTVFDSSSSLQPITNSLSPNLASGSFNFEAAMEALRIRLSPGRFTHTTGVVTTAEKLAAHYAQDIERARIAALLHDCAKEYSADKKRTLCQLWGVQLDTVLEANIDLTHSMLGAESAKRDSNIHDPAILQAIRCHTTGCSGMTMLDKIIMLADYIEPYRGSWGPTKEMRSLAFTDINQALIIGTEYTLKEDKQAGNPIHKRSYDMLRELSHATRGPATK